MSFSPRQAPSPATSVILVMDDVRLRDAVSAALQRVGYAVTEAGRDDELRGVLRTLQREPQRVRTAAVVVDLQRPGHGAIEAAELLRGHGLYVPLIALSSHPRSSAVTLTPHRVTAILQKPVDVNELRALLDGVSR